MMPSLFSAVSGLKGNQEMMDVIGNNIANVNTPGFKSSSVNFADLLSQTMKGASLPTSTTGGTNPIQVGQGTNVASVDTNFTNGSLQQTGNNTDLGVNGDGLFILGSGGNQYYTRDGDFSFDASGNLVSNTNGMTVQGWMASGGTISTSATPTNVSINLNASTPAQATSSMVLSGNLNSSLDNGTLLFSSGTGSFPFSVTNGDTPPTTGNWQFSYSPAGPFNTWNWTITDASTGSTLDAGTLTLDSTTGKITSITQSKGYTGTVGTSTGDQAVASSTSIIEGVNDNINLAVNGGTPTAITIPAGSYTPAQLVTAVNTGIANSTLAGSVTAALDSAGSLTFTSASGTNAVAVSVGTDDASAQLGFYNGNITNGTATSVNLSGGLGAAQTSVKLTVGNQTYDNVNLTALTQNKYAPGANTFKNNAATEATLQEAFNEKFGTGVVQVGISGNDLTLTSNYGNVSVAAATTNGITGANWASTNYNNNNDAGILTATTSTGDQTVASSASIIQGVNDNINLAVPGVNGGAPTSITIAPSPVGGYTPAQLVAAVNTGIAGSALAASGVAATLVGGKLTFTCAAGVAVSAGTDDASAQLGFYSGTITNGIATSGDLSGGLGAAQTSLNLTVGNQTYDNVDLTALTQNAYAPGANTFKNNAATEATLQEAFNEKFGTGVVTVGISGNDLTLTSNYGNVSVAAATTNGITGANFTNNYNNNNDAGIATGSGTSTGNQALAASATITAAVDNINLAVNGGTATPITIPAGSYTPTQLATAVNTGIASSALAGSVTAAWDSTTGMLTFTSASGPVVASAASTNDASALLGFLSGTSTSDQAVANTTNIIQGVNDNINLAVNGGAATPITIPAGSYTPAQLVTAVNTGITNSALAGSVTAALDGTGKLAFTSTSGPVVASAGTDDASAQLGFYDGTIKNGTATSVDLAGGLGSAGQTSLKLTVGNQTYDNVNLTALAQNAYTPGANTFKNNAATEATLQEAFNEKFGTGVVTVGISGNVLTLTSNYGNVSVAAATTNGIAGATFTSNNYNNNNDAGIGTFAIQEPAIGSLPNAFSLGGSGSVTTAGGITAPTFTPPTANVIQTVYDALGNKYSANIAFIKNSVGSWNWKVQSITDSAGNTYTPAGGTGSLQFSSTGSLPSGTGGSFSFTPTTGSVQTISLNFSGLTQDDAANSAAVQSQNGYTSGTLQNYTIDQTGTITGSFSNGVTQSLGQIALANFPNPGGLASDGSNLYAATANSGTITVQPAGTGSLGTIQTGSLEMSNVNLSQEMSNMIIAQSGFDANSKVITTDDQLLQTLVNMVQA